MNKNIKIALFFTFLIPILAIFAFFAPFSFDAPVFAKDENLSHAKSMVVIEKTSNRILYSHNETEKLPMASLTKIITAIYVIEHTEDLDKVFEIPKEAVGIEGTSIGLKQGEHLTVRELLYGLMLRSGNDAATALAIITSGNVENFVKDVNLYLSELGFKNTQIRNPHGLHHDEHYTTAYDLARITARALENNVFGEIVSTQKKEISNELKTKTSRNLVNKNKLLKNYEYADGVKTGYTRKAGRCFVGSATKDDMQVICVLLNCGPMFEDCQLLLEKAFIEYEMFKLVSEEDNLGKIIVKDSKEKSMDLYASSDFYYPLKREELKEIKLKVNHSKTLSAPIKEGEPVGDIEISFKNQLIFSDKIYSIKYIKPNTFSSEFQRVIQKM